MASITLEDVCREADGTPILDGVDLAVADGELVVLLGPSGSGKTSLLRVMAGLDPLSRGRVVLDGMDVTLIPSRDRDVAMVFQTNSLFGNRTARRNVGFPLEIRRQPQQEMTDRVTAESRALDIEEMLDRWPDELSEGHQRLVSIARALVRAPRLFLLDEPLVSLDPPTRRRLRREIRLLQSGYGVAMIYATNDPEDALAVADRVAVMDAGRLVQIDDPSTLWKNPVNRFVAEIIGLVQCIEVVVERNGRGFWLNAPGLRLRAWAPALADVDGSRALIGIRPDAIRLEETGPISATLGRLVYERSKPGREIHIGPHRIASQVGAGLAEGTSVSVTMDSWYVFDQAGKTICAMS